MPEEKENGYVETGSLPEETEDNYAERDMSEDGQAFAENEAAQEEEKEHKYIENIDMMLSPLRSDDFYKFFIQNIESSDYQYEYNKKAINKIVEKDWLEMIESCLIPLDSIVRKPRKFIKQEEDIVSIALSKKITTDSIKHLAQHTNMISSIDEKGFVTPERILNINKEESMDVYENRFIYTLLLKLNGFITKRMNLIISSLQENESAAISVVNNFKIDNYKYNYKMEISYAKKDELSSDARDISQMSDIQRVSRIANIVKDFLSSPFAADMKKSALVRPPITRTNAILKDPNLKKALVLWQFVESYDKDGFFVETTNEANKISSPHADKLQDSLFINYLNLRNFLDPENPLQKTHEPGSRRKMARNLLTTMLDERNLSDTDLQEIYDRLWAKKARLQKINRQKYNDIIDRALKTDKEIRQIKEKRLKEDEQRRIAEEKAKEERKKEFEQRRIAKEKAKEDKQKEFEQKSYQKNR